MLWDTEDEPPIHRHWLAFTISGSRLTITTKWDFQLIIIHRELQLSCITLLLTVIMAILVVASHPPNISQLDSNNSQVWKRNARSTRKNHPRFEHKYLLFVSPPNWVGSLPTQSLTEYYYHF